MKTSNSKVDAFIGRARAWREEMDALREIVLNCGLDEQIKWGKPCYTFNGGNVAIFQPFKPHCALMFFKGVLLQDPEGLLVSQGENSQAAKRLEFTSVEQIARLAEVVQAYVREAIEVEKAGLKVEFRAKHELVYPDELVDALDANPDLRAAFEALTPGRRRAYVLHFSGAKQAKTRAARIEKCVARILANRGLTDR